MKPLTASIITTLCIVDLYFLTFKLKTMKKLLFMLLAFTTLTINANSVEKLTKSVTNVVDSTKIATVNGVNFVDTSSTFKTMYQDVKSGIMGLAEGLKVGAEHVYIILVKQQVVKAVTWLILSIFSLIIFYFFCKGFKKGIDEDWGERLVPYTLFLGGASLIFIVICGLNIETMVTGFINPEYGAIMDIINFVKH